MEQSVAKYHKKRKNKLQVVDSEGKSGKCRAEKLSDISPKTPKGGSKMLSGEFRHGIDPKNRLFIPSKHREELTLTDESFMVAKSIRENCLKVYSMSEWEEYISPIKRMERKDAERILRALHKDAAQVTPDSQGRIVLPPALVQYAGIVKGAVIVGCGSYGEIWAEEAYETMVEEENLESMRAVLESYGL